MNRRKGFTIVELLVALALIIFMMSILSQVFATATQTFRNLKAAGDMAERLRVASQILRRDLAADHFEGKRRMSDPNFWTVGPPTEGFFRIFHGSPYDATNNAAAFYHLEGTDLDGLRSYRAGDHALHFTVKLRGQAQSEYFTANVPQNSPLFGWNNGGGNLQSRYLNPNPPAGSFLFNSQWAEVVYFLQPTGETTTGPNPQPLYALYRRQRVLLPDTSGNRVTDPNGNFRITLDRYPEVSVNAVHFAGAIAPPQGSFNSPADVTIPSRRFWMQPPHPTNNPNYEAGIFQSVSPAPPPILVNNQTASPVKYPTMQQENVLDGLSIQNAGADVLLSDVISFEVRPLFGLSGPLNNGVLVYATNKPNPNNPNTYPNAMQPFMALSDLTDPVIDTNRPNDPLNPPNLWNVPNNSNQTIPAGQLSAQYNLNHFLYNNPAFGQFLPPINLRRVNGACVFDTWSQALPTAQNVDYSVWNPDNLTPVQPYSYTTIPVFKNFPNPNANANPVHNGTIRVKAIQIVLRIWDYKTSQTRQATIIQDL